VTVEEEGPSRPGEDWRYVQRTLRWGIPGRVLRNLICSITGRDSVEERERERWVRETIDNAERYAPLEKQAYETIRQQEAQRHSAKPTDGASPSATESG